MGASYIGNAPNQPVCHGPANPTKPARQPYELARQLPLEALPVRVRKQPSRTAHPRSLPSPTWSKTTPLPPPPTPSSVPPLLQFPLLTHSVIHVTSSCIRSPPPFCGGRRAVSIPPRSSPPFSRVLRIPASSTLRPQRAARS
jgi:hypothetical protein